MSPIVTGALYGLGAWCIASAVLVLAYGLVRASAQARANAAIRATRRQMRADPMDDLIERADFDLWAIELGAPLPTIDFEEWDK